MSTGLKAQVAELVRAKRYTDAIKLLEKSNDKGAAVTIGKLKARMALEQQAEPAPLPFEEPVRRTAPVRAKRRGCWFYGIAVVVVLVLAAIPIGISVEQNIDTAFLRTGLFAYCLDYDKAKDCDAWRDAKWQAAEAIVRKCDAEWHYPQYDASFERCLHDAGI